MARALSYWTIASVVFFWLSYTRPRLIWTSGPTFPDLLVRLVGSSVSTLGVGVNAAATAAVVLFHDETIGPSVEAGGVPPRPTAGFVDCPPNSLARLSYFCFGTSGAVLAIDESPLFQNANPPAAGDLQPTRPLPTPITRASESCRLMLTTAPPCTHCTTSRGRTFPWTSAIVATGSAKGGPSAECKATVVGPAANSRGRESLTLGVSRAVGD